MIAFKCNVPMFQLGLGRLGFLLTSLLQLKWRESYVCSIFGQWNLNICKCEELNWCWISTKETLLTIIYINLYMKIFLFLSFFPFVEQYWYILKHVTLLSFDTQKSFTSNRLYSTVFYTRLTVTLFTNIQVFIPFCSLQIQDYS